MTDWIQTQANALLSHDLKGVKRLPFERADFDVEAIAIDLQREGAQSFVDLWNELMTGLSAKGEVLQKAG